MRLISRRFSSSSPPIITRRNEMGIQMLSERLNKSIFNPDKAASNEGANWKVDLARKHLEKHNLWKRPTTIMPEVDFLDVPRLLDNNIYSHFQQMSKETHSSYFDMAIFACKFTRPPMPPLWNISQPGWTKYTLNERNESKWEQVSWPDENILVFDVEVLNSHSKYPAIAVAVTDKAWYTWISPAILSDNVSSEHLIPFRDSHDNERLIIGHAVSYDRARILDEYRHIMGTKNRFLDTMSLHVAIAGLSSVQRPIWRRLTKDRDENNLCGFYDRSSSADMEWVGLSCANSLKDLALFYLDLKMDKSARDIFIVGDIHDVRSNIQELMTYCANDVAVTHDIFKTVFPKFMSNKIKGNMVSFAGILEMGSGILPVCNRWNHYLETCDNMVNQVHDYIESSLRVMAQEALQSTPEERQSNHYLRQLDWSPQSSRNPTPKWFKQLLPTGETEPKISIKSRVAPLLLQMTWLNFPLYYLGTVYGWCFRVPVSECTDDRFNRFTLVDIERIRGKVAEDEAKSKTSTCASRRYLELIEEDSGKARFFKLPCPSNGAKNNDNCGSPFSKAFLNDFIDGTMGSSSDLALKAIQDNVQCSYWNSSKDRIKKQFVVPASVSESQSDIIIPLTCVMGTITRRATESTWLTASNAKSKRIGSELKSMVQAPKGYKIVGADVDSQELWIASLMGDAQFGMHGATAFGWMTLQGSKADGTDLHSKSAQILGSTRDHAKIFNYARIYGSGLKFSTDLLQKCDPSLNYESASARVQDLYRNTKGVKKWVGYGKKKRWVGGTESFMFNSLETIALSERPQTPALGCEIPDSLMPLSAREKYITSCVNWAVQSSGVDYLHMILSSMSYLTQRYDIKARLLITIHDEIRYLVKEEDAERAALALQISNLWTRSLFAYQCGIHDLPLSVAFFSSVDVDQVLRKEVNDKCKTPSMPEGIAEDGRALTIYDLKGVNLGAISNQALSKQNTTAGIFDNTYFKNITKQQLIAQM